MPEPRRVRLPGAPWAWAATAALAILLAGIVVALARPAFAERTWIAATPAPAPSLPDWYAGVDLSGGSEVCMRPVALPADGRIAELRTVQPVAAGDAPPLTLRIVGRGGYAERVSLPRGGVVGDRIRFDVTPPERALAGGTVCLRNDGRRTLQLVGSTEVFTASARPVASVDGAPIQPKVALTFYTGEGGGIADHLGDLLDHAAAFKPFGPVLLGLAALLLVLGLPAATVGMLVLALRRG